jgi:uncharacterized membrane protein
MLIVMLQMLSIALAPILGLFGVTVGVFLTEHSRRRAYITEQRRKTYEEFLSILSGLTVFHGTDFIAGMRNPSTEKLNALADTLGSAVIGLQHTYLRIRLVGSPAAVTAASEGLAYVRVGR